MKEALAVVMPVWNEQEAIQTVCLEWLSLLESRNLGTLVVVDDGSTDRTPAILNRLAGRRERLRLPTQANAGHGAAVLRGYREAVSSDCHWVFQVDSDGQFSPEDFPLLWDRRGEADLLLGERVCRQDQRLRVFLSALHRLLLRLMFGVWIPDPNIPYRLIRATALRAWLAEIPPTAFAPNVLLSLLAARRGRLLAAIPVRHFPRRGGSPSIRGWKTLRIGWRWLKELIAFRRSLARP